MGFYQKNSAKADANSRNSTVAGNLTVAGTTTLTGVVTATAGVGLPQQTLAASGAVTVANGSSVITLGSAGAFTIAAPTAAQAGMIIEILSTTAFAHVITGAFNAAGTTATFGAAALNRVTLLAFGLRWYVINSLNVTIT